MSDIFTSRMDVIYFFYGASFLILGAVCWIFLRTSSRDRIDLPWLWLGAFGFFHGVNEWLDMASVALPDSNLFRIIRLIVLVTSYVMLIEFAREGCARLRGLRPSRVLYLPLFALGLLGGCAGWTGMVAAFRYSLGLVGGLGAAWVLMAAVREQKGPNAGVERGALRLAGVAMGLYGIASGLIVGPAPFFPASDINTQTFLSWLGIPIQFFRGIFAFLIAACMATWAVLENVKAFTVIQGRHVRRLLAILALGFFVLVIFFAVTARVTDIQGQNAFHDEQSTRLLKTQLFALLVSSNSERLGGIEALSTNPQVVEALEKPVPSDEDIEYIYQRLCRYVVALSADVCYLMDTTGKVIATSNRDSPKSFLGKNYAFRSYFQGAVHGRSTVYFARGVTSGERGVYSAFPVRRESDGTVLGVVVAKGRLDVLAPYFTSHPYVFLVSPEGVVFVSSRPEWVYRALTGLSGIQRETLRDSRQFGDGPWDGIGFEDLNEVSRTVRFQGKKLYFATHEIKGMPGWRIFFMETKSMIALARLVAILIFLGVFCVLSVTILFVFRFWLDSQRVAASEAFYEVLIEGTPDEVELYDIDEHCLSVNKTRLADLGRSAEDVVRCSLWEIWPEASHAVLKDALKEAQGGRSSVFEVRRARTNGEIAVKSVRALPVFSEDKREVKYFILHARDVTLERQAQERVAKSSKMETVGALATGVAHEFNNVLEIIRGHAELAVVSSDLMVMKKALKVSVDAARRGSWIVKSLLDFSRKGSDQTEVCDIRDVLKKTFLLLGKMIEAAGITLETDFQEAPRVACNPEQMMQVFSNIIVNARDAMRGMPARKLRVGVDADVARSLLRVSFTDTGAGVSQDIQGKIFGPFVTTKGILGGGADKEPGLGLGLFVAYGIVKNHGGDITFVSEEGKGATFCVTLPLFHEKV